MDLIGLPNCDTCRKARTALDAAGLAVRFRDVRADPLAEAEIAAIFAAHGDEMLNRRSTTWRGLSEAERSLSAPELIARHPTLLKRPVIRRDGEILIGWDEAVQAALGLR